MTHIDVLIDDNDDELFGVFFFRMRFDTTRILAAPQKAEKDEKENKRETKQTRES
jgi:hypothetical protein